MKRYTGNYIIRWTDKNGNKDQKVYSDYSTVLKAKKWLLDNGALEINIAVEMKSE